MTEKKVFIKDFALYPQTYQGPLIYRSYKDHSLLYVKTMNETNENGKIRLQEEKSDEKNISTVLNNDSKKNPR